MSVITSITVGLIKFVEAIIIKLGLGGVFFLMLLEGMLLPIPSEIVMTFSGYLAFYRLLDPYSPYVSVVLLLIVGSVGDLIGAWIAYWIGKYGGDPFIIRYGKYLFLKPDTIDRTKAWFNRYGDLSVFITRFIPVFRTFISIPAGIATMNFRKFSIYTLSGDIIFNVVLIYLGILFGSHWEILSKYFTEYSYVGIAIFAVIIVYLIVRVIRNRNRNTQLNK
ncbi:DedA family protein [Ferroplasma acidarmanus]|uniref:Alkaline phosphatase like protein n=1 Tax=Ferroplasma acidarmanus Fer1 TaxID=333146 RepID=S0AQR3_FERAC|nr:DedA family protein [Ferroplasma acidarmanus]AGO60405.1 alkaline phosphatase like protein [Ferroplasma acidarmanus Fer1]